jgi:5'-nucleotidase
MRILVSNDDGIDAPGIQALADALSVLGEVWTVAPATEQSAKSHALTMHHPLRVSPRGERRLAVDGTPADAVYLGLHELCPPDIGLVVSGINRGPNVADDTWYSGTVGAAREAAMCGLPALAVSLLVSDSTSDAERHWSTAAQMAVLVARMVLADPPSDRTVFNLNVPDQPFDQLPELKVCALGARHYSASVHVDVDPRGRRLYWVGGVSDGFENQPDSDGYWLHRGHPTLTPLHIEGTDRALLERWQNARRRS